MCIVAPCAKALQKLLDICTDFASSHSIVYNSTKSVCMCIKSKKYRLNHLPKVYLGDNMLEYVASYKYLGCIINETLHDNGDMKKTLRGIYARGNMLIRKFSNCSDTVKQMLFQTYCTNFYCSHLWWNYTKESMRKVVVAFNNSYIILMGLDRYCSASGMFAESDIIDNLSTIRCKYLYNFRKRILSSNNTIIKKLYTYCQVLNVPSVREFYVNLYTSHNVQFLN